MHALRDHSPYDLALEELVDGLVRVVLGEQVDRDGVGIERLVVDLLAHDGKACLLEGLAVRRGVRVVYITADEGAPEQLGRVACTVLLRKGESRAERVATYYSQACIRFVLNCVYGELFARNWERGLEMRDRIARDYGDVKRG